MKRIDTEELLDEHDAPRADVDQSLVDLRRINRWLGGIVIYRRLYTKMSRGHGPLSVLDIGTGSSDLLQSLGHRAGMRIGLDFKLDHLTWGSRRDGIHRVVGDAKSLPFRDGSVDLITSAHFFHHFSPDENVSMLNEALRAARVGIAVNDTQRNVIPLLVVRVLGALRLVGSITRFDAPASVLRGYTPSEARDIAARMNVTRSKVFRIFPFRYAILLWK